MVTYYAEDAPWSSAPSFECVKKSAGSWDLKMEGGENLWIGTGVAMVVRVFDPYKVGGPSTLCICPSDSSILQRVQDVERRALTWIKDAQRDTVVNGVMMTEKAMQGMIEQDLSSSQIKCGFLAADCTFYDPDGVQVSEFPIHDGRAYVFALQATSLWVYRKKIGVKWYARQILSLEPIVEEDNDWDF